MEEEADVVALGTDNRQSMEHGFCDSNAHSTLRLGDETMLQKQRDGGMIFWKNAENCRAVRRGSGPSIDDTVPREETTRLEATSR